MSNENFFSSGYSSFNQSSTDDENERTLVAREPRVIKDFYENRFDASNIIGACKYEIDKMTRRSFNETVNKQNQTGNLIFHVLASEHEVNHNFQNARITQNNQIFEEYLVDTLILVEALISRLKRDTHVNSIKNLINRPNTFGNTPIMIAVENDRLDMVKLLFPFARLESRNELARTAIHLACINGSKNCFYFLIENFYNKIENLNFINQCDSEGNTPLALANKFYSEKNLSLIKELIRISKFDINFRNNENQTLLFLVCTNTNIPGETKYEILNLMNAPIQVVDEFHDVPNLFPLN